MARIKQSICVPMFHLPPVGMGIEEICRAAAEIGYPAVEFWGQEEGFDDQVAMAKRHGLTVVSRRSGTRAAGSTTRRITTGWRRS